MFGERKESPTGFEEKDQKLYSIPNVAQEGVTSVTAEL